jgi:asparagine N-glycosylation enzyme membrane subunit Stt3
VDAPRLSARLRTALALAAIGAFVFALRTIGFEKVFPEGGPVVLLIGDGAQHARLASWSFVNFPRFLSFDGYLAGPLGGANPWPPFLDLFVAAIARAGGGPVESVETVLAWLGPVCGVIGVGLVYAAARCLASRGAALGAAFVYASIHIANEYGAVGNGDHHAFVATIGAAWLYLALAFVSPATRRLGLIAAGFVAVRVVMALTWNGSLLYVALADACVGAACVALGDRRRLAWFGVGGLVSAALIAPVVAASATPMEGPFSSTALSWLHVSLGLAVAVFSFAIVAIESRFPTHDVRTRLLRALALGIAACAVALALPVGRGAVFAAYRFLTMRDAVGAVTYEQMPLFPLFSRVPFVAASKQLGWIAYLVPIAALLPWLALRDARRRVAALLLSAWTAPLAVLTITQARYGNDLAAPFAVGLAIGIDALARLLRLRLGAAPTTALLAAAAAIAMAPSLAPLLARAPATLAHLRTPAPAGDPLLATPTGTLVRFALMIRDATPETPGFFAAGEQPDYGLLANANFGHTLRYYARRPVASDNFWDRFPSFAVAAGFGALTSEADALAALRELRVRYLVTAAAGQRDVATVNGRLQAEDGVARAGRPRLEQFRLITEGPRGGRPISDLFGVKRPASVTPYKLFEVVPGARLEVPAAPGTAVQAELTLQTPTGRRFRYRADATADEHGAARLRVPYASRTSAPTHAVGSWHVRAGAAEWHVDVDDAQVQSGATVGVDDAASRATH